MFTLVELSNPPPESLKSQLLQQVVDCFSDLSPAPLTAANPLYQLYQYVIGYEVHLYLQAMGSGADSARLLLALDAEEPSRVFGFALCLPSADDPAACTLHYLAVQAAQRRHGIGRALLQRLLAQYPHAALACLPRQVPFFEAQGFAVLACRGSQVLMNTRSQPCAGRFAVQALAPIFQSREVRQIHAYLLKQHGEPAMRDAEVQRDALLDELTEQARRLVDDRLAASRLH